MPIVTFWLNAFIPLNVTGYTRTLTAGPHSGKTAIPLPGIARLWPGNTFKDWDAGYLSDQRGFSSVPGASCRMQSIVEVEMAGPAMISQTHRSSGTTEVNLVTGVQTGFAVADMSRCSFTVVPKGPPGGGIGPLAAHTRAGRGGVAFPPIPARLPPGVFGSISIQLIGQAGDPLVGMAADIDYVGTITFSGGVMPGSVEVSFNGMIDDFPAYDCYATFNGVTKTLFTDSPPAGHTVANLLGPAKRAKTGRVMFP
jgi:hypothetical protein